MIENARRQLFLILAVVLLAVYFVATKEIKFGPDLKGGTELIYEVDIEQAVQQGIFESAPSETEISNLMQETVSIVAERIDPTGVLEAIVVKRGKTGLLVELPAMETTELDAVAGRVKSLGRLEMRLVASENYNEDGVTFDLGAEKKALEEWLELAENQAMVDEEPDKIRQYNLGLASSKYLQWVPQRTVASPDDPKQWGKAAGIGFRNTNVVSLFTQAEITAGVQEGGPESLIAFYPVNTHAMHFTGEDLDAAGVRATTDRDGKPAIGYRLKISKTDDYADWSEENLGELSAIMLNGYVYSAPVFRGRIAGSGVIEGQFTDKEVSRLVKVLKTGSLRVAPIETSRRTIGASLGQKAVQLGFISILSGGIAVLLFILAYYRLAGLVAFTAIALNIFLIFGAVSFIEATLTLPGIAGLVLTMGMAVDANILIYERIREERARGKEIMQAVRVGFERAMVTILDANITTFLAGLVLFNVGVGPIRGFAVTLMIGIVTSVFTAFFVSRIVFHYLLASGRMKEFSAAKWFSNFKFDFLRHARPVFAVSILLVVAGLISFLSVDRGTKLGLDFTGGAKLKIVVNEPMTAAQLREKIASSGFKTEYPSVIVNTVGEELVDGKSNAFNVKVKLTGEQRDKITQDRRTATLAGEDYAAPYVDSLESALGGDLVADAFTNIDVVTDINNPARSQAAVDLHFTHAVKLADVSQSLREAYGEDPTSPNLVTAIEGGEDTTQSRNIHVEFNVPGASDTEAQRNLQQRQLGPLLSENLRDSITSADGTPIALSEPIPESEEIGGRMVGELRNAAIAALIVSLFLIVMFIRIRFHEYKYGLAAVAALIHDVLLTLGVVVAANAAGLVNAELDLAMIAAFLTIIGYSINDTIVIFDRVRENLNEQARLGEVAKHAEVLNHSINQTLSRTILTTATTFFVVLIQFVVNRGSGSSLEGFSFALLIGLLSGTYSTIFIASPIVLWLRNRESAASGDGGSAKQAAA